MIQTIFSLSAWLQLFIVQKYPKTWKIEKHLDATFEQTEQIVKSIQKLSKENSIIEEILSDNTNKETDNINNSVQVTVYQNESQSEVNMQQEIKEETKQSQQTDNQDIVVSQIETIQNSFNQELNEDQNLENDLDSSQIPQENLQVVRLIGIIEDIRIKQ